MKSKKQQLEGILFQCSSNYLQYAFLIINQAWQCSISTGATLPDNRNSCQDPYLSHGEETVMHFRLPNFPARHVFTKLYSIHHSAADEF